MQRIELYIGEVRVDLGNQNPVLFNYTVEELRNPSIMKNSYSQQLTLPGTAANCRAFQSYFRLDAAPGTAFNPSRRVPFTIYADGGVVLESGYCKLDSASSKGGVAEFKVTLYGGLGGFLYSLQYTDEKTRSLADLLYKDGEGNPVDLGFTINRAAVAEAWANAYTEASKWSCINFAPCYNGFPDKFDAGRALVKAANYGLETSAEAGAYTARNGFVEVELPGDMNEWQVKDLRSYLQRPVISARAVLRAICDPANNGGYRVDLDGRFFSIYNQHYYSVWMTLKMLTKLSRSVTTESHTAGRMTSRVEQAATYGIGLGTGSKVITARVRPSAFLYDPADVPAGTTTLQWGAKNETQSPPLCNGLMFQAVAYDSANNPVAGSKIVGCTATGDYGQGTTAASFAAATGFVPVYDDGSGDDKYGELYKSDFAIDATGSCQWNGPALELSIQTAVPVDHVIVYATKVQINTAWTIGWDTLFPIPTRVLENTPVRTAYWETEFEWQFTKDAEVRTGTDVSQAMLLSDTMSPAEFLLSYCKRYGLAIRVENDRKVVHIETRAKQYENQNVFDLADRVDRSKDVSVVPVPFASEKLELKEDGIGAAYAEDYKARFGVEYGAKRLNTGFEFNADVKQLISGSKFKSAPEVKARDLCFLNVTNPSRPAVFLNSGLKYHLWAANNRDTTELVVPYVPSTAVLVYWDDDYKTYDDVPRLQLCDGSGKGKDGDGVLVFYQGLRALPAGFDVSDDIDEMYLGNKEKPCWFLEAKDAFGTLPETPVLAPCFGRFRYGDSRHTQITEMLEFGTPMEVDMPGATILPEIDVYRVFWANYVADRYNPATKVMACTVMAAGIPDFGAAALRRFFWIDGALWVLNKISDYDINGPGLVKCEFVQVQNIANYVTL